MRFGASRRGVGTEHASDMGLPATARAAGGGSSGAGGEGVTQRSVGAPAGVPHERAEAAAHRASAPRQHAYHACDGDADVEQRAEAALVTDVLQRVVGVM